MLLNENIWGDSSTYRYIQTGNDYGTYKIADKLYGDILHANPLLQYPYYEKSTYRWGMPSDCSAGHITSCMWYSDSGNIKTKIREDVTSGVTPFTLIASTNYAVSSFDGMRAYVETYDSNMHYPPYSKNQATVENYSGSATWSGVYTQPYSHRLKWTTYNGAWYGNAAQCTKCNYDKNVWLVSATYCCDKGNYVSNHLSTGGLFTMFNGNLKALISHMRSRYNLDIANGDSVQPSDYHICGAGISLFMQSSGNRVHTNPSVQPTTFPFYKPSDRWQAIWYNGNVDVSTSFLTNGAVGCGSNGVINGDTINDIPVPYQLGYTSLPTQTAFFDNSTNPYAGTNQRAMAGCDAMSRASSKKQTYSDVSYHWDWYMRIDSVSYKLTDITTLPTTSSSKISIYPALVIDNYDVNSGDYFTACFNAVLHELAFYGLPLVTSYDDARYATWSVTQENIYIPEFDGHMITTGNFVTLKRSYELDNTGQYNWGDIFGSVEAINNYDADYQPPVHHEDSDFGDIENTGGYRYFPSGHHVYKLNATELTQFMQAVSSLYLTDADGVEQWTLDFKGTNPNDYIVGVYATLYNAPVKSTTDHLKINNIDLYNISTSYVADVVDVTRSGKYDCGSIYIPPYYGDFRDYAPYTTAELYLPLCGTVDIDLTFFIGHYMNIVYWIDILTASCSAAIYRDGVTLYKTVNGTIGAQIPILSKNMGDYQNTLHQLQQADKQNNVRLATSIVSTAVGAAAIIAAPETGGLSLAAGAGILAGVGGITSTLLSKSDINYQITHKQPSVSQTGATSPQNDFCVGSITPKLWIKRAKMLQSYDANIYAHTVGNACCINCKIGDMTGYTIASNIDMTGFNASAEEKTMLADIFGKGVYL